jgi:tetratricopeptide (TPR) repeat protein/tRNA A-37 threonylcarbamoyl transferase component Bud32
MDAELWQRVRAVYHGALDLPEQERPSYIARECGSDGELRREVESLLVFDSASADFLGQSPAAALLDNLASRAAPEHAGNYRIVREIGSGGMGTVYLGERQGEFRQQAAIKLVQPGLDSAAIFARFARERQILATLEHPNIARLIDGGQLEDGRPYFVMEYVDGRTLLEYSDEHRLSITERIALFRQVCSAVTHAHGRLIVHRDLKPGNILVTAEGTPKLLDFGLARLLETDGSTDLTVTGMRMMTVAYASPEQVLGKPVTVSADIYSLGLVLYELLTGARAYEVSSNSPLEAARTICEKAPLPPGLAQPKTGNAAEVASLRRSSPAALRRTLGGDLGTIIMTALRKDPERRYRSVEQFSEDLKRYVDGRVIVARADSALYRLSKFLRRNRVAAGAGALAVAGLAAGLIVALRENARAERRFNQVHQLANSIVFELHDAIRPLPGSTAARELLIRRALTYLDQLAGEADRPQLELDLGKAYRKLAEVQGGAADTNTGDPGVKASYQKAIALLEKYHPVARGDREGMRELARAYSGFAFLNQDETGLKAAQHSVELLDADLKAHPGDAESVRELGNGRYHVAFLLGATGRYADALEEYRRTLSLYQSRMKDAPDSVSARRNVALVHKRIGGILIRTNHYEPALEAYEAARAIDAALVAESPDAPGRRMDLSFDLGDMGLIKCRTGDHRAEAELYRQAAELRERAVAADPKDARARSAVPVSLTRLGRALSHMGRYDDADRALERAVAVARDAGGLRSEMAPLIAEAFLIRGQVAVARHDCRTARTWFDQAEAGIGALRSELNAAKRTCEQK